LTSDDQLRRPVFLGLRSDKNPTEVVRECAAKAHKLKAFHRRSKTAMENPSRSKAALNQSPVAIYSPTS
jgi:hypothetical protein